MENIYCTENNLILNQEIDLNEVLKDAKPRGVIHVGAYIGGCLNIYKEHGILNRCWIEADPDTFKRLKENIGDDIALNVAACDRDEDLIFNVTNNEQSSSLLPLKNHLLRYPSIVQVKEIAVKGNKLDTLVEEGKIDITKYNFLLMDLQGAEYYAVKGFEKNIKFIDYIVAEVNYEELYRGCMLISDFDQYLSVLGFKKMVSTWSQNFGWGDAYYKRI